MTPESFIPSVSLPTEDLLPSHHLFGPFNTASPPDEETALGIQRIAQRGGGGYSDVWEARMPWKGTMKKVALKVLRPTDSRERLRRREEREATWSLLQHDNIAPLYTVYHQSNGLPVFVSPWYENGTADVYLRQHPAVNPMDIILEIASGLEYLHHTGVVHGDLKGENVLIDDDGHARLIDFGLSCFVDTTHSLQTSTVTTTRWCAPELLLSDDARPTVLSDVYAFASTALELLTGNVPYNELGDRTVTLKVLNGVNPRHHTSGFQSDVPRSQELWDLLGQCWMAPSKRPSIYEVRLRLSNLYQ